MSNDTSHYEYICTHSDDFMIVSKTPEVIMEGLKQVYTIKSEGPPEYYLAWERLQEGQAVFRMQEIHTRVDCKN